MELKWLEITINTTGDDLDTLTARLTANGVVGLVIEDEEDFRQFLENNRQYWDYVDDELVKRMQGAARVKFYVTDDEDGHRQLAQYTAGLEGYEILSAPLQENDWATSWQKYYKPLAVGGKLYVVPEWEKGGELPEGKVPVWLNPGLTFGTGSHASTQLCLEALEQAVCAGDRVLDLGCGSGILSIAALCLGAQYAAAVDIDPKAVGIAHFGLISAITPEAWRRLFAVNVDGVFHCVRAALPGMLQKQAGAIITVSSMWGQVGASCEAGYSATKGAVIALSKALAQELGPSGIRVNCIAPGVIQTDMCAGVDPAVMEELRQQTPIARLGTPEDIAQAMEFLIDAPFITGQVLGVNGGFVIT